MSQIEQTQPAKPAQLRATYEVTPDCLSIAYRQRKWGTIVFTSLWLIAWTVGCVFLAGVVYKKQDLFTALFAIPFWVAWTFVSCWMVYCLRGRDLLTIDRTGLHFERTAVFTLARREIPLAELRGFQVATRVTDSESKSTEQGIEIRTLGKPLQLFFGLPEPELKWLVAEMSQLAAGLPTAADSDTDSGTDANTAADTDSDADTAAQSTAAQQSQADTYPQTLAISAEPVIPPSDCRWELDTDFDAPLFVNHGAWSWSSVLVLLFMCAFWNGIVSVFLVSAFTDAGGFAGLAKWGLLLFLIPFEVIGCVFLAALVFAIVDPFRKTTWRFGDRDIDYRWTWFGIGPRWRYAVEKLARVVIDRHAGLRGYRSFKPRQPDENTEVHYRLALIRDGNVELCEIANLTEGEARWIGDSLLRERSAWFRD